MKAPASAGAFSSRTCSPGQRLLEYLPMSLGDTRRRCACGALLARDNQDKVCGPCDRRYGDELILRLRMPGFQPDVQIAGVCKRPGCHEPITGRSAATSAPRWSGLCLGHYNAERARQSEAARLAPSRKRVKVA